MAFRFTRRLIVNFLEGTILVMLIAAACYVSAGRILASNVGKFRAVIEKRLSGSLNIDVHVGKISGSWINLDPRIVITDLVIGDPADPVVDIGRISARVDSIASARERTVVVRNLDITGVSLTIRRDSAGAWNIEGMPHRAGQAKPFNANPILDSIRYLKGVDVQGVNITVDSGDRVYRITNQANVPFVLTEEGSQKTLEMPLSVSRSGASQSSEFELLGRYSGDPRNFRTFSANLYLQVPQLELADFLPKRTDADFRIDQASLHGQVWLDCQDGRFEVRALPVVDQVEVVHNDKRDTLLKNFSAVLAASGWGTGEWQVHLANVATEIGQQAWKFPDIDLALRSTPTGMEWGAALPALDIGDAVRAVSEIGRGSDLVSEDTVAALEAIAPGGKLADIMIRGKGARPGNMIVTSRIEDAHINAWHGIPGVSSINGLAVLQADQGHIDIYNKQFKLDFESMFPEPWELDSARARINYERSPGYLRITSGLMDLASGDMTASGRVHLNLPTDVEKRTWGLEIGIRNTNLLDVHKYLPETMSEDLTAWLNRSIKGGRSVEAGLVFHGTLGKDMPKISKLYELYFKIADGVLDYDPAWPPVDKLFATLYIGDWGATTQDATGRVYSSDLVGGHVSLSATDETPADAILINADIRGPISDGIRILNETPVADATDNMAKGWIGSGDMKGSIKLNIPIGARAGEQTGVDVNISLPGANILMSDYNLDVLDIDGDFRYRDDERLSSPGFKAVLFKQPVTGIIKSEVDKNGGGAVDVLIDGKIDIADLYAWSEQTLLTRASGLAAYSAKLHIPFGDRASSPGYVEAKSNLDGVAIDLPPPMGKAASGKMKLTYRQSFLKPGYLVDLQLGDATHASLKTVDGIVRGGRIDFGAPNPTKVNYDSVNVMGNLDFVDYAQWHDVTSYLDSKSSVSLKSAAATTLGAIDVDVDKMSAFGVKLDKVRTHITRAEGAWDVNLKNTLLTGDIRVPDDDAAPLDVRLDYLHFVSDKSEGAGDPLAGMQPSTFSPIDFSTQDLTLDGEDYGKWSFKFRPNETGGVLKDLTADVKGLSIQNDSTVTWQVDGDAQTSSFAGTVKVPDLAKALKAWGFASSIEGEGFKFGAKLNWPGSPAMVALDSIKGMVTLDEGKGRFVQAEAGSGALKLLGIFDFASLARRFRFDFSDVVKQGFSFSQIKGSTRLDQGLISVVDPIVITASGSTLKLGGTVNLQTGKLDNDLIVTLPVSRNLPWYAAYSAIATGPLVGAGVWLAQKVFGSQIDQMSSAKYKISGTLDSPSIEFVTIFNDRVRESTAAPAAPPAPAGSAPQPTPGKTEG